MIICQSIQEQTGRSGSGLRSCDSQSAKLLVTAHGHVGLEFKLRPFSAGSILTFRNRIEPPASMNSVPGKRAFNHRTQRKTSENKPSPRIGDRFGVRWLDGALFDRY